jgi:hypothetical protein
MLVLLIRSSYISIWKMAVILAAPILANQDGIGEYKDFAPTTYSADVELKGTKQTPPASFPSYLPVWDKETK